MSHPYTVLAVVRSKSRPDKTYEIRFSNQDQTTYCTCMACIMSFNRGDGKAKCKHLTEYIQANPTRKVIVMDNKGWGKLRAGLDLSKTTVVDVDIHRGGKI